MTTTEPTAATTSDGALSDADVREATLGGVRWFGLTQGLVQIGGIVTAVVLARLIAPSDFGRLAVAIVVSELALMFATETIGTPLVQRPEVEPEHFEAAAFLGIVLGVGMALVTVFIVPLLTTPLFGASTSTFFRLYAPMFALAGVFIVPLARLQRELRFRRIGVSEAVGGLVGFALAIGLAIAGFGAKAYVLGTLGGFIVTTGGYLTGQPPALPGWRPRQMRELLGFGLPAAASGFAGVWYRNIDYMILGIRLPAATVGFYYRAFTLGVEYERRLSGIVLRIAFPVYTRTHDPDRRLALRLRIVRANAMLVYPMLAMFIALAPTLMPWLFGPRWTPAILPAQILAVAGMASCIRNLASPTVLAAGRPGAMLVFSVAETLLYGGTVWIASAYGLTVVCIAVAAFQLASLLVVYTVLLHLTAHIKRTQIFQDLGPAVLASVPLLVTAAVVRTVLAGEVPTILTTVIAALAGALVYLICLRAVSRDAWSDALLLARRVLPRLTRKRALAPVSGSTAALSRAQRSSA